MWSVIIVKIVFIIWFFFCWLLGYHSFQTNPNSSTNCFQLILSVLQQLTTTFAQCVRLFLIFEQVALPFTSKRSIRSKFCSGRKTKVAGQPTPCSYVVAASLNRKTKRYVGFVQNKKRDGGFLERYLATRL